MNNEEILGYIVAIMALVFVTIGCLVTGFELKKVIKNRRKILKKHGNKN